MKIIDEIRSWPSNLPEKMRILLKVRNSYGTHQYQRTIPFTKNVEKIGNAIRDMEVDHFLGKNWSHDNERKYFKIKFPKNYAGPSKLHIPWIPLTDYNNADQIRKTINYIRKNSKIPF